MINDEILADRLNLYREGKLEEVDNNQFFNNDSITSNLLTTFTRIFNVGLVFLHSLAFGFAIKTIFATDWNFIAFFSVGFSIELILTNLFDLLKNKNK